MRALMCRQYGMPDSLVVEDVPSPRPGPGELVVSVKAAGVNFPDVLMIQNKYQHRPPLPFSPGYEIAGVVKEVGPGVSGIERGDAGVAIVRAGGFAEEALVDSARFQRIPDRMDFRAAAAFPLAYGTSYYALKERGALAAGETLLVMGAAGGVGLAAVQLGKLMGARVIAAASSAEKLAICKRYGADELIDYSGGDLRERLRQAAPRGVDVALDPVGGFADSAVRGMAWGGRYLVVGFASGEIPKVALNLPLLKGCAILGVPWDTFSRREPQRFAAIMAQLADWIAEGRLQPALTAEFPLDRAAEALDLILRRKAQGKLVVVP